MSIAKDEAKKLLETLPDSATWDDIMYQIYVRAKISEGLNEVKRGELVSHEEVKQRFPE
jgi:predicted transcriptional regulator